MTNSADCSISTASGKATERNDLPTCTYYEFWLPRWTNFYCSHFLAASRSWSCNFEFQKGCRNFYTVCTSILRECYSCRLCFTVLSLQWKYGQDLICRTLRRGSGRTYSSKRLENCALAVHSIYAYTFGARHCFLMCNTWLSCDLVSRYLCRLSRNSSALSDFFITRASVPIYAAKILTHTSRLLKSEPIAPPASAVVFSE